MKVGQIVRRIKIIEDLAEELNKIKALYEESLDNDDTFQEIEEHAKALRDESKEKKQQVLDKPEIKEFMQQIKEIRQDMKENSEVLSQELADYYKESGLLEITDADGKVRKIKFSAKLVDFGERE